MPTRREFLRFSGLAVLGAAAGSRRAPFQGPESPVSPEARFAETRPGPVTLFLCGDVMTGRGIDQILARPSEPRIHEPWARSALDYVALAERVSGPIPRGVPPAYVWGEALAELDRAAPDLRIINLETSVTTSGDWQPKGINYRMHPANVSCLTAAGIDGCVLANNHLLDWGPSGLLETVSTLRGAGLATAGAGETSGEAEAPAVLVEGSRQVSTAVRAEARSAQPGPDQPADSTVQASPRAAAADRGTAPSAGSSRVLVWAWGSTSSGIPREWAAAADRPGVALLPDLSAGTAGRIAATVHQVRRPADLVVVSLHWGGNWGYAVPEPHRRFAHALIDAGAADVIHGHSSHHPKGIEVYRGRPILYGCGDFLNDYEGIGGHEEYRSDLVLGYLATLDPTTGQLAGLEMLPFRIRRFRLQRASGEEAGWLRDTMDRECRRLGGAVESGGGGRLVLRWS